MPKKTTAIIGSFMLLALIAAGIMLFVLRHQETPLPISHELNIRPHESTPKIIADEFLILVLPSHIEKLSTILEPLSLEVKTPILNWILVRKKGQTKQTIAHLGSEDANVSRLILGSLMEHRFVVDAQHNYVLEGTLEPKNQSFSRDWQLQNASKDHAFSMNLPAAWNITTGAKNVEIAVVDNFQVLGQFSFKEHFHDCLDRVEHYSPIVSSIIADSHEGLPHGEIMLNALGACINKPSYSSGIDWQAHFLAVERPSLGQGETFLAALLASGIDVCATSIIDCNKGVTYPILKKTPDILLLPFGSNAPELLQFSTDMINAISAKNVIVVSGAGNNHTNATDFFPGGAPGVINVSALNQHGQLAEFSNWGPSVDLLAPGDDIELSFLNGPKKVAGTSISAAYVAGAISLMKSVNKTLSFKEAESILKHSAKPISCDQYCRQSKDLRENCQAICCQQDKECGRLSLDVNQAVLMAKNLTKKPFSINVSKNYLLYLRDEAGPKSVLVKNLGDEEASIHARVFDDNIKVTPKEFFLTKAKSPGSTQTIAISFAKEPFTRQTFKIVLDAKKNGVTVDRETLYVEYVPKR